MVPSPRLQGLLHSDWTGGHRSAGSLIQLCAGAWRHSPQFVKQERVTPKGLSWLPWPNIGLKHYQPPPDAPRLPINSLLQKPGPISLIHTLNTSPALIRGITPAGAKNPGEGGEACTLSSLPHYFVSLRRIICCLHSGIVAGQGCLTP